MDHDILESPERLLLIAGPCWKEQFRSNVLRGKKLEARQPKDLAAITFYHEKKHSSSLSTSPPSSISIDIKSPSFIESCPSTGFTLNTTSACADLPKPLDPESGETNLLDRINLKNHYTSETDKLIFVPVGVEELSSKPGCCLAHRNLRLITM
ncbi:unnamed protein product [Protopolystoma xenopodis]|uniref:Uncharacterized protein n=1 Tax=Protopolystoma xenopodis TaxID=117903 RepID=A0A448WPU0_9PLAT|nr:unnamed protein product [Protopolystoma xenopodis]